jgi:SNF2 family DNA or RNA helicase
MFVSEQQRTVLLNVANPIRILTVLPRARRLQVNGQPVVAVPHELDETHVLNSIGINVPSPILSYYKWPGAYTPRPEQRDTARFLTMNPRAFVLNEMGTGKTISVLWAYDYLRSIGKVKKLLVISPLSTLELTWADEIFRNFPELSVGILHGTKDRPLKLLADTSHDIYLINHDGINLMLDELVARTDIDCVVIDESTAFRNPATIRWKAAEKVTRRKRWLWLLTGTPTPNSPLDAWGQAKLVNSESVPRHLGAWRSLTMTQMGTFAWAPKPTSSDTVARALQPAIRYTMDQCLTLPPCVMTQRHVALTPDQARAYREMSTHLKTEHAQGQITAANEAIKASKLIQIACGTAYAKDGSTISIEAQPRIDVVLEIIEQATTKVIVFVPYTAALDYVADKLSAKYRVGKISGAVSKTQRDEVFRGFQHDNNYDIIVAQPAAMAHGLTLTAANTIVWYAPTVRNEIYEQANARVRRPGQKHSQLIVNVSGSNIERKTYARLKDKQSMQGLVFDAIKEI